MFPENAVLEPMMYLLLVAIGSLSSATYVVVAYAKAREARQ